MRKTYKGSRWGIILSNIICLLLTDLFAVGMYFVIPRAWVPEAPMRGFVIIMAVAMPVGLLYSYIQYGDKRFYTVNDDGVYVQNNNGYDVYFTWEGVKRIVYAPCLVEIHLITESHSVLGINYEACQYKLLWRDIVLQAQKCNPKIKISKHLIRKLQKEKLL